MNIYVAPIKFSNTLLLHDVFEKLSIHFKIELIDLKINFENAYSAERAQYFSTQIISDAIEITKDFDGKILMLTEFDLFVPVLTFIFGEAQLNGKHSIVSVCRLHEEFYSGISDDNILLNRTWKEIFHELGHNFGLIHCEDWDCVMHSSTSIEEVDIKGEWYCKKCVGSVIP